MRLADLRFLPKAIEPKALCFVIGSLFSIPFYFAAERFNLLASYPTELSIALTGGIITIALLVASLLRFVPDFKENKSSSFPVLYPLTLIMFSVLMATAANVLNNMVYFALYFLMLGIVLFLNEIREIVSEHTIGVSLVDKVTYDSSNQKSPCLGEESSIAGEAFEGNIRVNKGDTLLAKCEFIQDGRLLAKRLLKHASYLIYITADRPHALLQEEFKPFQHKLYCIDCFTNVYGFGEFKGTRGDSRSYTLRPTTIKQLHEVLREVRKRIVAEMYFRKDCSALTKAEARKVAAELASKDAILERQQNVWVVYDSISSLAPVFEMEPLLKFLAHDTTVDTLIGRNTLLLMKDGALDEDILGRLESVSEHVFTVKAQKRRLCVNIHTSTDEAASRFHMGI